MTWRRSLAIGLALAALGVFAEWAALQRAPLQDPAGALDVRPDCRCDLDGRGPYDHDRSG